MKTITSKYMILLLLMATFGCEIFLDEPIKGVQLVDNYFQTEEECQKFVAGCYRGIFQYGDWYGPRFFYVLTASATDDAWLSNPTQAQLDYKDFSRFRVTASNDYLYPFWEYMYKNIYQCNMAMEEMAKSPVMENNPDYIERLVAEVKFLRAYSLFELAKNFEALPLLTRVYDADELVGFPLSNQAAAYDQIVTDLLEAEAVLPLTNDSDDVGRINKAITWAYLSKAYLYQENWQKAKEYADKVINEANYSLEPVYGEIWDINNRNGSESIFEIQTAYNPNYTVGNSLPILTGGRQDHGWYYAAPSSYLEKQFLDSGDTIRLRASIITAHNEGINLADEVGLANVYDTDGITVVVNDLTVSKMRDSKSMRINRKFFVLPEDRLSNYGHDYREYIPKNHILMRLAEVKLIRAEAMWYMIHQAGGATFTEADIRDGDIHDIRSRVSLPDISSSGDALLLNIYHEKHLELAMEFKRWDEMRRAKHPTDGMRMVYHIMGPTGKFVLFNTQVNSDWWEIGNSSANREPSDKGIDFSAGKEWLPIPAHDMSWLSDVTY
jgi:tetratricopeptide (TPR) repeat protein